MIIGEFLGVYPYMNWHLFRLRNKMSTVARYVAVFPSSERIDLTDYDMTNQIFVPEALENDLLIVADHPTLQPFFVDDTVAYMPLSKLPLVNDGKSIESKIFFYLYSLLQLQQYDLVPVRFNLASVAFTDGNGWSWVDTRLRSVTTSDSVYLFELKQLFSSLSSLLTVNNSLIKYLQSFTVNNDEEMSTKTVTRQYLDACINFAKQSVNIDILSSTDKWIDVRDDIETITIRNGNLMKNSAFDDVLQDVLSIIGVENVEIPPQIFFTIENWLSVGIDLTQKNLTTSDYYILQQIFSEIEKNDNIIPILYHYDINIDGRGSSFSFEDSITSLHLSSYPEEYIVAWKVVYLYF